MAPKHPDVHVKLIGEDGNVFNLIAICKREMRAAGLTREEMNQFEQEVTAGNYDGALRVMMEWFDIC